MKTLKTISSALVVTLLVSTVSAPAMGTLGSTWKDYAKLPFVLAKDAAVSAKNYVVGENMDSEGVRGIKPAYDFFIRTHGKYTAGVAGILAAAGLTYAAYNYLTTEEAPVAPEVEGEAVAKAAQEDVAVEAPKADETVVEAPKAGEDKSARKPRMGARRMAKAHKAKVAAHRKAKRAGSEQRTAKRNAGCKNGKCDVRRGK